MFASKQLIGMSGVKQSPTPKHPAPLEASWTAYKMVCLDGNHDKYFYKTYAARHFACGSSIAKQCGTSHSNRLFQRPRTVMVSRPSRLLHLTPSISLGSYRASGRAQGALRPHAICADRPSPNKPTRDCPSMEKEQGYDMAGFGGVDISRVFLRSLLILRSKSQDLRLEG